MTVQGLRLDVERSDTGRRPGPGGWPLGFLLAIGVGIMPVPLVLNTQPVDGLIILFLAPTALFAWARGSSPSWTLLRRCVPWLWLILLADLVSLYSGGATLDGGIQIARDFFAFLIFFVVLRFLDERPAAVRGVLVGLSMAAATCAMLVIASPQARPVGTYDNVNLAAHFLAGFAVVLYASDVRPRLKWPLLALVLFGVVQTFSYGALTVIFAAAGYRAWCYRPVGSSAPGLLARRVLVVVALLAILTSGVLSDVTTSSQIADSQYDASRYDRSSSARLEGWVAGLELVPGAPQGYGPGAAANGLVLDRFIEFHNDYVSYLVERGVLGLVGLLGLLLVLWRRGRPGGDARMLMVAFAVGSLTRETLNYRHLWLMLALLLVIEWRSSRELSQEGAAPGPRADRRSSRPAHPAGTTRPPRS